jgi:hypothetical protein
MKVTMKFHLPSDEDELKHAQKGYDYYLALREIMDLIDGESNGQREPLVTSVNSMIKVSDLRRELETILVENAIVIL